MPYRVICDKCGYLLEEGSRPSEAQQFGNYFYPYYTRIRNQYYGKCPKCGRKLAHEPIKIRVMLHNAQKT